LLDADKFKRTGFPLFFEAERNDFSHAFHERIEALRLRVAATKTRNGSNQIAFLVSLD